MMKISQLLNKPTPSVSSLVKKYKTTTETVQAELKRGIQVEMEHTKDPEVAREIALDHLGEDLHYYKKLSKIEKTSVTESTLMELFDLNKRPEGVQGPNLSGSQGRIAYYDFAVDDKKYFVEFHNFPVQDAEIVFGDEHGNIGLTHTGNATKVFWSVAQCLVDYLERHPSVQKIYFTSFSDEPSRLKLYHSLSNRLAQQLGWHASSKRRRKDVEYYVTKDPLHSLDENSLLVELFDLNRVPLGVSGPQLISDSPYMTVYKFAIDNKKYELSFHPEDHEVEVAFSDATGSTDITGAGNATKVFWAVAKGLDDYLKNNSIVKTIVFISFDDEPSRHKLYHIFSNRLAQHLGWHAGKKHEDSYVRWTVTREEKARATETHSLMELFDLNQVPEGVTPPEMVSDVTDKTIYQFSVRGRKYLCQFTEVDRDTYDLKFKDPEGRMTITGAGEATKVFWGVARAVSMFIKHKPVALLRFGASEPSRQKLYSVLSQKLAYGLGWKKEIVKHPNDPASYFRLYNPNYRS